MEIDIKSLRGQLPKTGYVKLIKKYIPKTISAQRVRELFAGRGMNADDVEQIIDGAIKAVSEKKKRDQRLLKKVSAV